MSSPRPLSSFNATPWFLAETQAGPPDCALPVRARDANLPALLRPIRRTFAPAFGNMAREAKRGHEALEFDRTAGRIPPIC